MTHRSRGHKTGALLVVGMLGLAATSCGSDAKKADTTTAAAPTTAAPPTTAAAPTTAAGTGTTSAGTDTTAAGTDTTAAGTGTTTAGTDTTTVASAGDAVSLLKQLTTRPTKLTNTTPIGKAIPKGKTIMWIQCSVPACVALGEPLKEATDALGWTLKIVSHDGTPEGVKAAYDQAVREKPDGVVSSGYPKVIFETELAQLAAANIPVIQVTVTDAPGDGISAVINGPGRNAEVGRQLAVFAAADSGGKANALWATSTFPILVPELEGVNGSGGFGPTLKSLCDTCKFDKLEIPVEALATEAPARMVAYLQAHPDVNYVVGAFGDIVTALPGAVADAGLASKVKVLTYSQNEALSAFVEDGSVAALIGFPGPEDMWQVADTFARIFTGVKFEANFFDLPSWVITKGNVPKSPAFYPLVENYQDQYKKLWGLS